MRIELANGESFKYLTAARLIELLGGVQPECRIVVNQVGNLSVMSDAGNEVIGHIDFSRDGAAILYSDDASCQSFISWWCCGRSSTP